MASLALHHVAISCGDLKVTEAFYTQHFGFTRARVLDIGGGNQIVFLKNGEAYLELFQAEGRARRRLSTRTVRTIPAGVTSRSRWTASTRRWQPWAPMRR